MLEQSPLLIQLRDHPEFKRILVFVRSRADEQHRLVLDLERRGELGPVPFYGNQ